jgi:hypothetical protein
MMSDAPPSGFQKVTIAIAVKSDAPPEKLAEIERLALAGCPGIATLRDPVAVETMLTVTPPGSVPRRSPERPPAGPLSAEALRPPFPAKSKARHEAGLCQNTEESAAIRSRPGPDREAVESGC